MPVLAPETVETENTRVACDGGGGALGHPRVYLEMGDETAWNVPIATSALCLKQARAIIIERPQEG